MTDIASLALEIDSSSAVKAKADQDALTASGAKLEKQYDGITQAQVNANYASYKAAQAFNAQRVAVEGASAEVQKILNRYDPLGTKLRQLQSDFATLDKAIMAGATGGTSDLTLDKTMKSLNDEIAHTKGLMQAAGVAVEGGSGAMAKLGLNTQYARRELLTLGREVASGDFSRLPITFGSLLAHSNLLAAILSPVGLGITAVALAGTGLALAYHKGSEEAAQMNNALLVTSNYAGQTQSSMRALAQQMTETGAITIGSAKEIVVQLVQSGQIGAQSLGGVARLASDFAKATGKDVEKIAPELVKLFADPAKGAEELNKQMHYLSSAELEHIRHLEAIGLLDEAQYEAMTKLTEHIPKQVEQMGLLEAAWDRLKKNASAAIDAMARIGRPNTIEEDLKDQAQKVLEARQMVATWGPIVPAYLTDNLKRQEALFRVMQDQQASAGRVAALQADQKSAQAAEIKADALVRQLSQYSKINALAEKSEAIFRNSGMSDQERAQALQVIAKEARDLQLSIGAEGRAIANQRLSNEQSVFEIKKKGYEADVATLEKTHEITRQQADEIRMQLEIWDIDKKISLERAKQALGGTPQEMLASQGRVAQFQAQRDQLPDTLERKNREERYHWTQLQADADAKSAAASAEQGLKEIASLQEQVAKQREHNAEIGKTKEQVELLRAAELDRAIALLEYDRAVSQGSDEYIARLDAQIALLREQKSLIQQAGFLEANAAAAKQASEAWRTAAKDMQRGMSSYFFDIMQGKFDSLGQRFKQLLDKMVADALAARLSNAMFGTEFMGGKGPVGGWVGSGLSALANFFTPLVPEMVPGQFSLTNPAYGASGGDWMVGGAGGTDSQLVPLRVTPGETVSVRTPEQTRASGGMMSVTQHFHFAAPTDNRTLAQIGVSAQRGLNLAKRNL